MGETYLGDSNILSRAIRTIFSILDIPAYWLLGIMYQIFFNVASADIFSTDTIIKFYNRIQLIIGVYMMFLLAVIIIQGIMNPDNFSGSKSTGKEIIRRIFVSLILFTVLIPINVSSPRNEYEEQIKNSGLLFGTLFSLQYRILNNNTLGRLILGTDGTSGNYTSNDNSSDDLKTASKIFTSTVLKGFYRINLKPEENRTKHEDGKDDMAFSENWVCEDADDAVIDAYKKLDASPGDIIGLINKDCDARDGFHASEIFGSHKYFVFNYMPIISTAVAIYFAFVLLSFTFDIVVRMIKLAILRLIAPIPIIGYMDPKGKRDDAFNSWVKTLSATYLDLFLRLALVYFVIFLIQEMIVHGIIINRGTGLLGFTSLIMIWIGLFMFAKQAPKFIKQVLGIKEGNFSLFGGLKDAMAVGSIGMGAVSGAISKGKAAYDKSEGNIGKTLLGGLTGLGGGLKNAGKEYFSNEKATASGIRQKSRAYNDQMRAQIMDGSTAKGRAISSLRSALGLPTQASINEAEINKNKGRIDALKAVKSRVSGEMVKSTDTSGDLGIRGIKANYKSFMSAYEAAKTHGASSVLFTDSSGVSHRITMEEAENQKGFLLKNNEDDYLKQVISGSIVDDRLTTLISNANKLGGSSRFTRNSDGTITKNDDFDIKDRKSVNDVIDAFEDYNTQLARENLTNKADDKYSSKK